MGAGTGHARRLATIATRLIVAGHTPILAVPQLGSVAGTVEIWQAPLWPGQILATARTTLVPPATLGDIMALIGLGDAAAVRGMIGAWDRVIAAARPDVVLAEYAPMLMLAARGRVPLVALGTGFSLPPSHLPSFPSLTGKPPLFDEARLIEGVNGALAANDRPPIDRLTALFDADETIVAVFAELDPYRPFRITRHAPPGIVQNSERAGAGEELFVYLSGSGAQGALLWDALGQLDLPVRMHDPVLSAAERAEAEQRGIIVEEKAVAWPLIARRSRLVLSHCGLGFVSNALAVGMPMLLLPHDIEKQMIAAAISDLGLGVRFALRAHDSESLAALIAATAHDEGLHARCAAASPGFAARVRGDGTDAVMEAVERLVCA